MIFEWLRYCFGMANAIGCPPPQLQARLLSRNLLALRWTGAARRPPRASGD